jgi:hypothetical protein
MRYESRVLCEEWYALNVTVDNHDAGHVLQEDSVIAKTRIFRYRKLLHRRVHQPEGMRYCRDVVLC